MSVLDERAGKLLEQKLCLFLPVPLVPQQKHERRASNAPYRGCPVHRDGLSCLSLSSDYYAANSGLSPGRNATFRFSHPQYWTGLHLCGHLLHRCTSVGILAPFWTSTEDEQHGGRLPHLCAC